MSITLKEMALILSNQKDDVLKLKSLEIFVKYIDVVDVNKQQIHITIIKILASIIIRNKTEYINFQRFYDSSSCWLERIFYKIWREYGCYFFINFCNASFILFLCL